MSEGLLNLWPKTRFPFRAVFRSTSNAEVESTLDQLYSGAFSVLFSSGRAAISAVLEVHKIHRSDYIWCPPYSSHCVLESIARHGTPTPLVQPQPKIAIVYHQWGYIHKWPFPGDVVEDSADSLLVPGRLTFPNDGMMQIISLPKIVGSFSGGVVFCKKEEDAAQLKTIRDGRPASAYIQLGLRLAGGKSSRAYGYWSGMESVNGRLPACARRDILTSLKNIDSIINDRREKIELVRSAAIEGVKFSKDRLPCVIPIEINKQKKNILSNIGLGIGSRHFNQGQDAGNIRLTEVFPLPIHQGVSRGHLERYLKLISE